MGIKPGSQEQEGRETSIAIIIPTFQEASTLQECLTHLQRQDPPFEVFVSDGGSPDGTLDTIPKVNYPLGYGVAPQRGRAAQMNWGAAQTHSPVLLFLHADSRLPPHGLQQLRQALADPTVVGGRFQVALDNRHWPYPQISWGINARSRLTGIFTGDMGIFIRRPAFEALGGYPLQPLMEDLDLSGSMRRLGRTAFLDGPILTSSRRFERLGPWKTIALMQFFRLSYRLGVKPAQLARWYHPIR